MISPIDVDRHIHSYLLENYHMHAIFNQFDSKNDGKLAVVSSLIRNLYFNRRTVIDQLVPHYQKYVDVISTIKGVKYMHDHLKNIRDFYIIQNRENEDLWAELVKMGLM